MQILRDLFHLASAKAINISRQHVLGQFGNGSGKSPFQFIDLLPKQKRGTNAIRHRRFTIQCERHGVIILGDQGRSAIELGTPAAVSTRRGGQALSTRLDEIGGQTSEVSYGFAMSALISSGTTLLA